MNRKSLAALVLLCAITLTGCQRPSGEARFQTPGGFTIEVVAPAEQTGSLIAMTFDSFGRPVVSKERGHPTILSDTDGDAVFETEKAFTDKVRSCQGLWFDARVLYAVCNDLENQAGLYRLEDTDGDDVADTFERINTFDRGMGEHGPHNIRRAPEGLPTIMLGNHTFVPTELLEPSSPLAGYKEWQLLPRYMDARGHAAGIMAPGGTLMRFQPANGRYTLLAGGFRNAYSHAYNLEGEAFTFDSDMEWDINLPWYRDVRSVHIIPGADYGWRTGSGKFPAYYIDTLPPIRDLGRGSPVGVEFYQHHVYPPMFDDGFFEADWSRGRILFTRLRKQGATYVADSGGREFVHGEPLNVTDLAVGPDGFVYFTTGGRDTEGGFYRVRYHPGFFDRFRSRKADGILAVVRQPQPLSSWGHAALLQKKQEMGERWAEELQGLARNRRAAARDRVQALLILERIGPRPTADLLRPLSRDANPDVRAAAIFVAGQHASERAKAIAAAGLRDVDPFVRRRAAEALVRMGLSPDQPPFAPWEDIYALLGDPDRFVRYAGRIALERTPRALWEDRALREENPLPAMEALLALIRTAPAPSAVQAVIARQMEWLKRDLLPDDRLRLLRTLHIAAAELPEGLTEGQRRAVHAAVAPWFPSSDERLNYELARTLAYCGQPEAIGKIIAAMPREEENQKLQIHYAYCLRAMKNGWTKEQKMTLLNWFQKAAKWRGGASFSGYINLMFDTALEFFDEEEKKYAFLKVPEFAPLQDMEALRTRRGLLLPSVLARKRGVESVSPDEIYEFQMFDPMTLRARPERGREIYEKECASCHRFGDIGQDFGPDLTTINRRFKKKDILEAILWPSRTISDQYQSTIIETKEGDILNCLIVSEDAQKVTVKTAEVERPVEIAKSQIKDRRKSNTSIMPEGLLDGYGMIQIANLIAFLQAGPGQ
jgi:putative heme-binding domain-containing protein